MLPQPIKPVLSLLIFLFTSLFLSAQDKNPFQSIGKKGKILTLSNGKYEELFDQDSIQHIGTVLVNIRQMKIVKLLQDEKEAQRLLDNSSTSRFLSVDPLTYSYPELTPYQFASNRPIEAIDLDGLEAKDLYMELEPVRVQRNLESQFGITHSETKGQRYVRYFVTAGLGTSSALLGTAVLAPLLVEAPGAISSAFWWSVANPNTAGGVVLSIVVAATGYQGPDIPGPADDFGKYGRKVYDKLVSAGIKNENSLAEAARNSYNAIIKTIDNEIKDLVTMEEKARKAFDVRNKAKDFARELSGPNNKKAAEEYSKKKHGSVSGPSFDDLFKKHYDEATNSGLQGEEARKKAYQSVIDASKRPSEEVNKKYGAN